MSADLRSRSVILGCARAHLSVSERRSHSRSDTMRRSIELRSLKLCCQVAFTVPQNSIYKPIFDKKIIEIIEAGLTKKYFQDEMDKQARAVREKSFEAVWNPLAINNLQAPILLELMMCSACMLVFCIEVLSKPMPKYSKKYIGDIIYVK